MPINSKQFFFFYLNLKTLTYVAVLFILLGFFFIQIENSEICIFVHVYICVHVSALCVGFYEGTKKKSTYLNFSFNSFTITPFALFHRSFKPFHSNIITLFFQFFCGSGTARH